MIPTLPIGAVEQFGAEPVVQPEYRGDGLPFGPEVPAPAGAPALDRFLAFSGRDPRWTAPKS